jgi:general secretion pathway protein G
MTLVEMLVVLAIISILAAAALPYAEVTIRRNKEIELREALRAVRTAIDGFHEDWKAGRIARFNEDASADGYPVELLVMVEGVETANAVGSRRYYLRRIPRDPFADPRIPPEEHWALRSYQDEPDAAQWGGQDIYDIRTKSETQALDGTWYRDW